MNITVKAVPLDTPTPTWAIDCSACGPVEVIEADDDTLADWAAGHLGDHGIEGVHPEPWT